MVTLPTLPFAEEQCLPGNGLRGDGGWINRSGALLISEEQGWARGVEPEQPQKHQDVGVSHEDCLTSWTLQVERCWLTPVSTSSPCIPLALEKEPWAGSQPGSSCSFCSSPSSSLEGEVSSLGLSLPIYSNEENLPWL